MFKSKYMVKCVSIFTISITLLPWSFGCSDVKQRLRGDNLYNRLYKKGINDIKEPGIEYSITDQDILEFSNDLRHMFRAKMQFSTIAAYVSGVTALATAAAATTLAATGGTKIGTAGLSAASIFTGDALGLFKLKERVNAYVDGLEYLEAAEARYFGKIAGEHSGRVSNSELTIPGAELYFEVVGSLKLVEKALAARIPTKEDIEAAIGEYEKDVRLKLYKYAVSVETGAETQILAVQNGPITDVVSDKPVIATGKADGNKITIFGHSPDTATITVSNGRGGVKEVKVQVIPAIMLSTDKVSLDLVSKKQDVVDVRDGGPITDISPPLDKNVADGKIAPGGYKITITGISAGNTSITVTSQLGAKKVINVEVK